MKYIILRTSRLSDEFTMEIENRRKYLFDIFKLYFVNANSRINNDEIILESFPFNSFDLLFIKGENKDVYNYLKQNSNNIKEKTVVLITCGGYDYARILFGKDTNLYICKLENGIAYLYDGNEVGLNFKITLSEIEFYNNRNKNIDENIEISFVKLIGGRHGKSVRKNK